MQLTVQKELVGKMHFSVAKGIKLQSWKDSGFECKVKEENIPKISIQSFCNLTYLLSFLMPLFSQAYCNTKPNLRKMKISSLIILQLI